MMIDRSQLDPSRAAAKISAAIDRQIKSDGKSEQKYIKLLLLGEYLRPAIISVILTYSLCSLRVSLWLQQNLELKLFVSVGPGEAGKSTLIRQMQLIHGEALDIE